ncbi:MAG: cysteine desulfurase, partial [Desulfobacteraceae bacterium]
VENQYWHYNANIHRGIHFLSESSTARIEHARNVIKDFLCASEAQEVIFTSGTTLSVNIVAGSYRETLEPGDEVIVTEMEHHSNFCPWQNACKRSGATLKIIPVDDSGNLNMDVYKSLLSEHTRLVAVTYCSNVLGTVNPVPEIIRLAHEKGARVLVDGAQIMRHTSIDVKTLDCDFLCFSGHKIMGPYGTGVLYGKCEAIEELQPVNYGGGMIDTVTYKETVNGELPFRLEAGTINISGITGLASAIQYIKDIGIDAIARYENELLAGAEAMLSEIHGVHVLGSPSERAGVMSFVLDDFHYYDTAAMLDKLGIAVRSGHLCAQPLLSRFGLSGVIRMSPAFYNTKREIEKFVNGIEKVISLTARKIA